MDKVEIPEGSTCYHKRINKKWYIVWSADFLQDESGKMEVSENDAFLLECGYLIGLSERKEVKK